MSKSVNAVQLLGHLGRDAEVRHTPSGKAVVGFSVATSRRFKQGNDWKSETDWHDIVFWNGENVAPYLTKGTQVYISGRLQTRSWEQDGHKRYKTEVVAQDVILLGGEGHQPPAARDEHIADEDVPF
jgi:single-strand DNA-binding protein